MKGASEDMDCELPEVPGSVSSYVSQLVRYGATALGGYLVGHGWIEGDTASAITSIAVTATPIIVGVIIGRTNRQKLAKAVRIAKSKDNSPT